MTNESPLFIVAAKKKKKKDPVDSSDQAFSVISACDEIRNIPVKRDALELNSKKRVVSVL